jgi:hypothetical protein
MNRLMTSKRLRKENHDFDGAGGVSACNHDAGFIPAFCDTATGRVEPSRCMDGSIAPVHLLTGLPREWVVVWGEGNEVLAVKETVIAGFLRTGVFFTRDQAARVLALH